MLLGRNSRSHHVAVAGIEGIGRRDDIDHLPLEDESAFDEAGEAAGPSPFDASASANVVDIDPIGGAVGPLNGPRAATVFAGDVPPQLVAADSGQISRESRLREEDVEPDLGSGRPQ